MTNNINWQIQSMVNCYVKDTEYNRSVENIEINGSLITVRVYSSYGVDEDEITITQLELMAWFFDKFKDLEMDLPSGDQE